VSLVLFPLFHAPTVSRDHIYDRIRTAIPLTVVVADPKDKEEKKEKENQQQQAPTES